MKKQLLALAAFTLTLQLANAQTEKGRQNIGLTAGVSISNNKTLSPTSLSGAAQNQKDDVTSFNIGPDYSYFIADNLDLGVSLNYNHNQQSDEYNSSLSKQTVNTYGGAVYLRKYVLYDNKIGFRTGGRAGYAYSTNAYNYNYPSNPTTTENKVNQFYGGLLFDLVYYPSKKFGITATIANATFTHYQSTAGSSQNTNGNNFSFNFINNGLYLGLFYTFGGK